MGSSTDCISVFDSTASGSDSQCNCDRQGIYMYACVLYGQMDTKYYLFCTQVSCVESAEVVKVSVFYSTNALLAVMLQVSSSLQWVRNSQCLYSPCLLTLTVQLP